MCKESETYGASLSLPGEFSRPIASVPKPSALWDTAGDLLGQPHPIPKGECCGNDFRLGHLIGVSRAERQVLIQRARDRAQALHPLFTNPRRPRPLKPEATSLGAPMALP